MTGPLPLWFLGFTSAPQHVFPKQFFWEECHAARGVTQDMPISTIQSLKLLQLLRGGMVKMDEKVNFIGAQALRHAAKPNLAGTRVGPEEFTVYI